MTLAELKDWIGGVGFPIAVAVYLLVFLRGALVNQTKALASLREVITALCAKIDSISKN